jgi:hypothetical protein
MDGDVQNVMVGLFEGRHEYDRSRSSATDATSVAGVGDEAFVAGRQRITVFAHGDTIQISTPQVVGDEAVRIAEELAPRAVSRLD